VPLSRSPDFHAVIHQRAGTRRSIPFTACFPDFHAFTRLHGSPYGYELPFHALTRASRSLSDSCRETARSASFTCFEAVSLLRVRFNRVGFPLTD
jgi:hypothetical protein